MYKVKNTTKYKAKYIITEACDEVHLLTSYCRKYMV